MRITRYQILNLTNILYRITEMNMEICLQYKEQSEPIGINSALDLVQDYMEAIGLC